jgi:hypothetical protein
MKRLLPLPLLIAVSCAGGGAPPGGKSIPTASRAPYESAPSGAHSATIEVDAQAAREILAALGRSAYDPSDAGRLQALPAVRLAVRDSGRPEESFERDLAAAFEEDSRPAVFDLRPIKNDYARWQALLTEISARQGDLIRMASERARALLPGDGAVSTRLVVLFSFGLAGLADHIIVGTPDGREVMIVDLARALGETDREPVAAQLERLARLIAGEAFRQIWSQYRAGSPKWTGADPALGVVEPLLRVVAEAGPAAVFFVDENFFPLFVWLKEPMSRNMDELNRTADRLVAAEGDLDQRVQLAAEIKRPEFTRRLAGPAGAFITDGIFQVSGIEALRQALAGGPRAFVEAYDRASQTDRRLIPLSRQVLDRLVGKSPGPG